MSRGNDVTMVLVLNRTSALFCISFGNVLTTYFLDKLSCTDKSSEDTPGQHGGSLQTRSIGSMRAHVLTNISSTKNDPSLVCN